MHFARTSRTTTRKSIVAMALVAIALVAAACSPSAGAPSAPTAPAAAPTTAAGGGAAATMEPSTTLSSTLATTTTPETGTALTGTTTMTPEAGTPMTGSLSSTTTPEAAATAEVTPMATVESTATAGSELSVTRTPEAATTVTGTLSGTATPAAGMTPSTVMTGTGGSGAAVAPIPGVNIVTYTAKEYAFQGPATFAGGWTQFVLNNQGQQPHDLQIFKLAQGKTLADVITALSGGSQPDWVSSYGGITVQPGKIGSFVTQVPAGNYVILSFGNPQSGPPDAARGMLNQVTVTAPTSTQQPTLPKPAATIDMVDYHFVITGTINSGEQLVRFVNSGTENHEAAMMKLKPGKTMADVQAAMQAEASGTPTPPDQLPVDQFGNIQLGPGAEAYASYNFTPGDYIIACFIPSPKNGGKPHVELGMIQQITVK